MTGRDMLMDDGEVNGEADREGGCAIEEKVMTGALKEMKGSAVAQLR